MAAQKVQPKQEIDSEIFKSRKNNAGSLCMQVVRVSGITSFENVTYLQVIEIDHQL